MRAALALIMTLIVVITGLFYYVFYTPAVVLKIIPMIAERYVPEIDLRSITVQRQRVEYPNMLRLYHVQGELTVHDRVYQFDVAELDVPQFIEVWKIRKQVALTVVGLNVHNEIIQIKEADAILSVVLDGTSVRSLEGNLQKGKIRVSPYNLENIQAQVVWTREGIKVNNFKTDLCGGQVNGDFKISLPSMTSQLVNLEFTGLKSEQLKSIHREIFSQIKGDFNGTLRLNRVEGQIQILALLADMPSGAVLSSGMGKRIVGYMTDEEKRYAIQAILAEESTLRFDKAEFRILNVNQNLVGITFTFDSKAHDLHIQETVNVDIARMAQKIPGIK